MNHLQTFEAFGREKSSTVDLAKSRQQMGAQRRELLGRMAGIRQQISSDRERENELNVEPVVVPTEVGVEVEVAEPTLVNTTTPQAQLERHRIGRIR